MWLNHISSSQLGKILIFYSKQDEEPLKHFKGKGDMK